MPYISAASLGQSGIAFIPLAFLDLSAKITDWTKWNQRYNALNAVESLFQLGDQFYPDILPKSKHLGNLIRKVEEYMWLLNLAGLVGSVCRTISFLNQKVSFIPSNLFHDAYGVLVTPYTLALNFGSFIGFFGWVLVAYKITLTLNEYFWPKEEGLDPTQNKIVHLQHNGQNITASTKVTNERPPNGSDIWRESILASRIFLNFVTFCVCPSPLVLLSIVSESACLYQLTKRRWINFTFKFNVDLGFVRVPELRLFSRIETPIKIKEDVCPICTDDIGKQSAESDRKESDNHPVPNQNPHLREAEKKDRGNDVVLPCTTGGHVIHLGCFSQWATSKVQAIYSSISWKYHEIQYPRDPSRNHWVYTATISKEALPGCSLCRTVENWFVEGSVFGVRNNYNGPLTIRLLSNAQRAQENAQEAKEYAERARRSANPGEAAELAQEAQDYAHGAAYYANQADQKHSAEAHLHATQAQAYAAQVQHLLPHEAEGDA